MALRETDCLHYPRIIWFHTQNECMEQAEVFLNLVKDYTFNHKGIEVVTNVHNVMDLKTTKSVHEYFEYLKYFSTHVVKTLCVVHYSKKDLVKRDTLLSKVTKLLTPFKTAYVGIESEEEMKSKDLKTFNYLIGKDKTALKLSNIIHHGP